MHDRGEGERRAAEKQRAIRAAASSEAAKRSTPLPDDNLEPFSSQLH